MTILFSDPLFLTHNTGRHVETADRLRAITARLEKTGLKKSCAPGTIKPLSEDAVAKVHDPRQILRIKQLCQHGGGQIDADTVVSVQSLDVALSAAGACVSAVDAVLAGALPSPLGGEGPGVRGSSATEPAPHPQPLSPGGRRRNRENTALCLVCPPGHHATPNRSMGFCLFNNIALAAYHAKKAHKLTRILIVDWDVHHGNGTQDIFYEDPKVMFFSIHRYPFYPGTGAASETGSGKGLGFTFNVPVKYGTPRQEYIARFTKALHAAADKIKPELVFISAGFDAHALDPIGSLDLEVEDFVALSKLVQEVAKTHAAGRIVSCLEGGYNTNILAECVEAHLKVLKERK